MKLRLNKKVLAEMPAPVRSLVIEWAARYRKAFICVENTSRFFPGEDAKVTLINLLTGKQQTERIAGEFAGMTKLSPTDEITLPAGCVAVVTGIFLGHPWLTIYQSCTEGVAMIDAKLKLGRVMVEVSPATRGGFGCNMDYKP